MDLHAAFRQQGRKQRWLAAVLGVSESSLSRKLRGLQPFSHDEAARASLCTGFPVEAFLRCEPAQLQADEVRGVA